MAPEDDPAEDHQPTEEEWDKYEAGRDSYLADCLRCGVCEHCVERSIAAANEDLFLGD